MIVSDAEWRKIAGQCQELVQLSEAMKAERDALAERTQKDGVTIARLKGELKHAHAELDRLHRECCDRETEILRFIGWLSGDIPELHKVEVPRLADSLTRFRAARTGPRQGSEHAK